MKPSLGLMLVLFSFTAQTAQANDAQIKKCLPVAEDLANKSVASEEDTQPSLCEAHLDHAEQSSDGYIDYNITSTCKDNGHVIIKDTYHAVIRAKDCSEH